MSNLILVGENWKTLKEQAEILVQSGFLPDTVNTAGKAIAIAIKGHELGMPPMQAYQSIHIVNGKPCLSAEAMLALVRKNVPDAKIEVIESTETVALIQGSRGSERPIKIKWTIEDARRALLMANPSWQKYPRMMLRWRAISELCRFLFPDVIQGMYTPEEMEKPINTGYDPSNHGHKKRLNEIFVKHGTQDVEFMKEISEKCRGVLLDKLEEFVLGELNVEVKTLQLEASSDDVSEDKQESKIEE